MILDAVSRGMGAVEKLLERMRQNPRNWRIEDLERLAGHLGFSVRKARGSHVTFSAPDCPTVVTVPAHKPVKPAYVRLFLKLADESQEARHGNPDAQI